MPEPVSMIINGARVRVAAGTTVAAGILMAEQPCRISVTAQPRSAFCGMGVCFECCAIVNGIAHRRTCQMACEQGMTVETNP